MENKKGRGLSLRKNEVKKNEDEERSECHEMENAFRIKMCCHIILIEALNVHKLRKCSVNNEHQKSQ